MTPEAKKKIWKISISSLRCHVSFEDMVKSLKEEIPQIESVERRQTYDLREYFRYNFKTWPCYNIMLSALIEGEEDDS